MAAIAAELYVRNISDEGDWTLLSIVNGPTALEGQIEVFSSEELQDGKTYQAKLVHFDEGEYGDSEELLSNEFTIDNSKFPVE